MRKYLLLTLVAALLLAACKSTSTDVDHRFDGHDGRGGHRHPGARV